MRQEEEMFPISLYETLLHVLLFCLPHCSLKIIIPIISIFPKLPCPWSYLLLYFESSDVPCLFEMTGPQQFAWGCTTDLCQDILSFYCSSSYLICLLILSACWKDGVVELSVAQQKTRLGDTWGQSQWSRLLPKTFLVYLPNLFLEISGDSTAL